MLEKLLALLRRGDTHSYGELALKLDITEPLLVSMLEMLERMGYVRQVSMSGCAGHCQGCAEHKLCAVGGQGKLWTLVK
jgi:Mn-dependent DtxR family transcriptional regulator